MKEKTKKIGNFILDGISNQEEFWQAKFEYYRTILVWVSVAASLSSIAYYISDCYLMGGLTTATLIPRLAILVPLAIFLVALHKTNNYKVIVTLSYVVAHGIMWCTIWACIYLTNLDFATEGFVIINYVFMALGIAAPIHMGIVAHGLLLADICIANLFIPYPDFNMMMLLGVPSYLGICAYNIAVEKSFRDRYMLQKKLEESLTLDTLTGAYNRNIMSKLVDENKHFISEQNTTSVIMFDLDLFKNINDTYGHSSGDRVLVDVCELIKKKLLNNSKLIRWGGEEFIIVTYDNLKNSLAFAEELRKTIQATKFEVPNVTISAGVAPYDGGNYEVAIKHADEALYCAKNQGRNQVVQYSGTKGL